jgi:ATP-dependent RNA helicase SUPV3L1/SUV3
MRLTKLFQTSCSQTIALLLEKVPTLTLRDRFSLCQAPINSRSLEAMSALLQYAKAYAEGGPVPLEVTFRESSADIAELEWKHQVGPQT